MNFYLVKEEINLGDIKKIEDDKGAYINQELWRKNETIELSSPHVISSYGLLYYVHFCNQFFDKGKVKTNQKHLKNTQRN